LLLLLGVGLIGRDYGGLLAVHDKLADRLLGRLLAMFVKLILHLFELRRHTLIAVEYDLGGGGLDGALLLNLNILLGDLLMQITCFHMIITATAAAAHQLVLSRGGALSSTTWSHSLH